MTLRRSRIRTSAVTLLLRGDGRQICKNELARSENLNNLVDVIADRLVRDTVLCFVGGVRGRKEMSARASFAAASPVDRAAQGRLLTEALWSFFFPCGTPEWSRGMGCGRHTCGEGVWRLGKLVSPTSYRNNGRTKFKGTGHASVLVSWQPPILETEERRTYTCSVAV